jgi:hypothetical protein
MCDALECCQCLVRIGRKCTNTQRQGCSESEWRRGGDVKPFVFDTEWHHCFAPASYLSPRVARPSFLYDTPNITAAGDREMLVGKARKRWVKEVFLPPFSRVVHQCVEVRLVAVLESTSKYDPIGQQPV